MVKHTQTIRWLFPTNCLSVFDHFVGLALKGLKILSQQTNTLSKLKIKLCKVTTITKTSHRISLKLTMKTPTKSLKLTGCVCCISIFTVFSAEFKEASQLFFDLI